MALSRPVLEVAEIFRHHGQAYREQNDGHLSRGQRKVMGAVEACRTAGLGGHIERCCGCGHSQIAYNSCRNRHCPKCQASTAKAWLAARQTDLLPVEYFHIVFTLPAPIRSIAYQNKAVVYAILFEAAAKTLCTIAADNKHLGAKIAITMVLHTWGQTLTHHPHVHCIVPGGGLSAEEDRWISCKPGYFLPERVLSRLFRRLFLTKLKIAHHTGKLRFSGELERLAAPSVFASVLAPLRHAEWVVYAKRPFAGPDQVLTYLSRYTHRVAISNHRLLALESGRVSFTWKDYAQGGVLKCMRLDAHEFIRRFLLHVLPDGFQRIRHYGFLANGQRKVKIALIRRLFRAAPQATAATAIKSEPPPDERAEAKAPVCPCCGGPMAVIEILPAPRRRHRRLDSS